MKKDSINVSIFAALKVSEKSGVPVLLMANPGMGKSTTVEMFSKIRGYHLELLRGNSESAETILGYDVAPTDTSKSNSTTHLRPKWFQNILDIEDNGGKTLLFLDEITTANESVQSALLHLIFERKVGSESIPEDTLIVSAGNYASNLSNSMVMLPPLMNRFLIFNIVPEPSDIDTMMCRYDGGSIHNRINFMDSVKDDMKRIDDGEKELTQDQIDLIGDCIEKNIRLKVKSLWNAGKLNLAITDLQNIYNDMEADAKLPGFVTFRTLNYLVSVSIASYKCFGKAGIQSSTFKNMITGLVGIGAYRDSSGEVKFSDLTDEFFGTMKTVINDIEKMNSTKLPQYEKYFRDVIEDAKKTSGVLKVTDVNVVTNKLKEMMNDKSMGNIERPIDPTIVDGICDLISKTSNNIVNIKKEDLKNNKEVPVEKLAGIITDWGYVAGLAEQIKVLVTTKKNNYGETVQESFNSVKNDMNKLRLKLNAFKKLAEFSDAAAAKMIPKIATF